MIIHFLSEENRNFDLISLLIRQKLKSKHFIQQKKLKKIKTRWKKFEAFNYFSMFCFFYERLIFLLIKCLTYKI